MKKKYYSIFAILTCILCCIFIMTSCGTSTEEVSGKTYVYKGGYFVMISFNDDGTYNQTAISSKGVIKKSSGNYGIKKEDKGYKLDISIPEKNKEMFDDSYCRFFINPKFVSDGKAKYIYSHTYLCHLKCTDKSYDLKAIAEEYKDKYKKKQEQEEKERKKEEQALKERCEASGLVGTWYAKETNVGDLMSGGYWELRDKTGTNVTFKNDGSALLIYTHLDGSAEQFSFSWEPTDSVRYKWYMNGKSGDFCFYNDPCVEIDMSDFVGYDSDIGHWCNCFYK